MKIHVITNCTNLKKKSIKEKVGLKNLLSNFNSKNIVTTWLDQLNSAKIKLPAHQVYAGDHWKVATSINDKHIELWILSAGYGLIHNSSMITAYDATFSKDSENSIHHTEFTNKEWWDKLHQTRDNTLFGCASINALIDKNKTDTFFIAASPDYLKVIEKELLLLIDSGKITKNNLFIISSKQPLHKKLMPFFFESNANFSSTVKGGRVSLNIRLAKYLLSKLTPCSINNKTILTKYNELKNNTQVVSVQQRAKLTDNEIKQFIKYELKNNSHLKMSSTSLLKILRNQNLACEQKRFTRLLKESL